MIRRRARLSVPLALSILTLSPAVADAAQRFASTTGGTTEPCNPAPCDISTAATGATSGDEVIVAPGTYTLGAGVVTVGAGVDLHGAAGSQPPLLTGSNIGHILRVVGLGHAADLRIEQTSTGANTTAVTVGGTAERLQVTSTAIHACTVDDGGVLRDSFCVQSSVTNGSALFAGTAATSFLAKARNVTAISIGANSYGARMTTGFGGTGTLNLRNVIASGTAGDIRADTQMVGGTSTVEVAYSNYDAPSTGGPATATVVPAGTTNQSAAPLFVNAVGGDYREASGSPTIDAGAPDPDTGSLDVDGEPRQQGASVDIGGDEFTPAVTPPAADTTPPETSIDKGPKRKTKSKNATFRFSADEAGSTFRCKLDKAAFSDCVSPLKLKRLKRGRHVLTIAATDAAGNADESPAIYGWKVKKKRKKK